MLQDQNPRFVSFLHMFITYISSDVFDSFALKPRFSATKKLLPQYGYITIAYQKSRPWPLSEIGSI